MKNIKTIDKLVKLHGLYKDLYSDMELRFCGVGSRGIQLQMEGFKEIFKDEEVFIEDRNSEEYRFECKAFYNGVMFYAIGNFDGDAPRLRDIK